MKAVYLGSLYLGSARYDAFETALGCFAGSYRDGHALRQGESISYFELDIAQPPALIKQNEQRMFFEINGKDVVLGGCIEDIERGPPDCIYLRLAADFLHFELGDFSGFAAGDAVRLIAPVSSIEIFGG